MPEYIDIPFDSDPDQIAGDAYDYLRSQVPGWAPAEGNLETTQIKTVSRMAAEIRDLVTRVPKSIFRFFGKIADILPIAASYASAYVTFSVETDIGYTVPAGTVVGYRATGGVLVEFRLLSDLVFNPLTIERDGLVVAVEPGISSNVGEASTPLELVTPISFVSGVEFSAFGTGASGGVDAETDLEYLTRLATKLQTLAARPILARDFAILARDIAGVWRAQAIDGYNPFHNLLTANQASAETDSSGWNNVTNATVAGTSAQAANGTKSISLTAIAAADMGAETPTTPVIPVVPGDVITGVVSIRANTTTRSCKVGLRWYTSGGAFISVAFGSAANDSSSAWTAYSVTATAPATAAFVVLEAFVTAPALGEVHYVDKASIRRGSTTDWVAGGTAETNNERTISVAGIDADGLDISSPLKADVSAYLEALREVNFLVYVISPQYTTVDVTYHAKALPGYDPADVLARVNTALASYLSPANRGIPPAGTNFGPSARDWVNNSFVRYREVDQVINDVVGLDYIITETMGVNGGGQSDHTDITLPGIIPLTLAGTISGTVDSG